MKRMPVAATLLSLALLIINPVQSQTLTGTVQDEEGHPLTSATVLLPALQRWTSTDNHGTFTFAKLPKGRYLVEASLIGYAKTSLEVDVPTETPPILTMHSSPLEMPEVTVTAEAQPAVLRNVTLPTTVLDGRTLERDRGASLGQTIGRTPGVSGLSGGPFSVRPVIRGLSGQRVLVLADGERLESQSWDEPQSPEVDILDADRIEIVRGAASVLYGSDAIGGVVNAVRKEIPSADEHVAPLSGTVRLNAFSNNPQGAAALSVSGVGAGLGYRANFTTRIAGDYSTPGGITASGRKVSAGTVFNSGAQEFNGSLAVGMNRDWGTVFLDAAHFGQGYQIAPEPGRKEYEYNVNTGVYDSLPAAPHQEILHERATIGTLLPTSIGRLEFLGTWQRNYRREEGVKESEADEKKKESLGIKPEAELILNTVTLEAKAHHLPVGDFYGTIGGTVSFQNNVTEGQKAIIPGYNALTAGAFLYEVYQPARTIRITGGVRYDSRQLDVDANTQLGNSSQTRRFDSFTATGGIAWNVRSFMTLALNAGRGWRAPVAAELFFNGADEGAVRYKIGTATLRPEESLNLDASLRFSLTRWQMEFSAFRTTIDRYIFLTPSGFQIGSLDVYRYVQANASLVGGELWLRGTPLSWLIIHAGADLVHGTNEETNNPLPLIPAGRVRIGARLVGEHTWGINMPYCYVNATLVARQNRPGPFETASPPYTLVDAGVGGTLAAGSTDIALDLAVQNLLDRSYYDHLSRYKNFALNPGRNLSLKASVPFTILR